MNMSSFADALSAKIGAALETATPSPGDAPAPSPSVEAQASPPIPPVAPQETPPQPSEEEGAASSPEEGEEDEFSFSDERGEEGEGGDKKSPPKEEEGKPEEKKEGDPIPKEVESAFLKTNRGRRMLSSFKTIQELERDPAEGGLGFAPTAEQIKEAFTFGSDMRVMSDEFHSGDPNGARNFVQQWFGLDGGKITLGARTVAQQILPTLAQVHPDLYNEVAIVALDRYQQHLLAGAMKDPSLSPEERAYAANVAIGIQHLTGMKQWEEAELKELQDSILQMKRGAPTDRREEEINQKLKRIEDYERRNREESLKSFSATLEKEEASGVRSDIQEALKSIKDALPESIYGPIEEKVLRRVREKVGQNTLGLREVKALRSRALNTRDPGDIAAAARAYRNLARPVIKLLRGEYLRDASGLVRQRSDERNKIASMADGKRGSTSVAKPTAQSILPGGDLARQEGEDFRSYIERTTSSLVRL